VLIAFGGVGLLLLAGVTYGMAVSARRRADRGRRYLRRILPFQVAVLGGAALALAAVAGAPRIAVAVAAAAWLAALAVLAARALLGRSRSA